MSEYATRNWNKRNKRVNMNDLKNSDMMHEMMALKVRILDHYNDILCEYAIAVFRGIMVEEPPTYRKDVASRLTESVKIQLKVPQSFRESLAKSQPRGKRCKKQKMV